MGEIAMEGRAVSSHSFGTGQRPSLHLKPSVGLASTRPRLFDRSEGVTATKPQLRALGAREKAQRSVWFSRWHTDVGIFSHKTTGTRRSRSEANRSISRASLGRAKFESCFARDSLD